MTCELNDAELRDTELRNNELHDAELNDRESPEPLAIAGNEHKWICLTSRGCKPAVSSR